MDVEQQSRRAAHTAHHGTGGGTPPTGNLIALVNKTNAEGEA